MSSAMTPIETHEQFQFNCSPQVTCFNACCHDLNQFLYPYDVLRLKQTLQISSGKFLNQYTTQHAGPETGLPSVSLKFESHRSLACPFVTSKGCGVYSGRPASCRLYPVARAISRHPETGTLSEHFALIKEYHCCGFQAGTHRTVHEWMKGQGAVEYNRHNDRMIKIIGLKRQHHPQPLSLAQTQFYYRTLYDLDYFRETLDQLKGLKKHQFAQHRRDATVKDDVELLEVAEKWVIFNLFGKDALETLDDELA